MDNLHSSHILRISGHPQFLVNIYNLTGHNGTIYSINVHSEIASQDSAPMSTAADFDTLSFLTIYATGFICDTGSSTTECSSILVEVNTAPYSYAWISPVRITEFNTGHKIVTLRHDDAYDYRHWAIDVENNFYLLCSGHVINGLRARREGINDPYDYYYVNSALTGERSRRSQLFEFEDIVSYEDHLGTTILYCWLLIPAPLDDVWCCKIVKKSGKQYRLDRSEYLQLLQRAHEHIGISFIKCVDIIPINEAYAKDEV